MFWRAFADFIILIHMSFIIFVLLGGFLAIQWRWLPWVHLPACVWGAAIELSGWVCPLTPLENWLRYKSGEAGYAGGFIEHYAYPVIYPAGLTHHIQIYLGIGVILLNTIAYTLVFRRRSKSE